MSTPSGPTYYDVLGVDKDASAAEIKRQYRRLSTIAHSDRGGDDNLFRLIKNAYDVLADVDARRAYDRDLDRPATRAPAGGRSEQPPGRQGFGPEAPTPPGQHRTGPPTPPPRPPSPPQWHAPPQPRPMWPPHVPQAPRPGSSSGRKLAFWGGWALFALCRWATTQPELGSAPGTEFGMYAGLFLAVGACFAKARAVFRGWRTRRKVVVVVGVLLTLGALVALAASAPEDYGAPAHGPRSNATGSAVTPQPLSSSDPG